MSNQNRLVASLTHAQETLVIWSMCEQLATARPDLLSWLFTDPDVGTLIVLLRRGSADCDRTDDDIVAPDESRSCARHYGCSRYMIELREQRRPGLQESRQFTTVAAEQRNTGGFSRGDACR
jgi:hypothetical protein